MALRGTMCLSGAMLAGLALPAPAMAQSLLNPFTTSSINITQSQTLRFGTFAVLGKGSKTVGAQGNVSETGLVTLGKINEGPAEFTLTWQRGNNLLVPTTVVVQVSYATSPAVVVSGINAQITAYESDLGGLRSVTPGGTQTYTFLACIRPSCSVTFRVGGRLDVSAGNDGAQLSFAVPVTARIVAEI
jgi:hypothetical protein